MVSSYHRDRSVFFRVFVAPHFPHRALTSKADGVIHIVVVR